MAYSFNATVDLRGYHVYKSNFLANAKIGEKVTVEMETKKSLRKSIHIRVPLKLKIVSLTVS